ncbi:MAG: NTP transferase domain-containing protein, partial [Phycisphaerales bacterium]|nr:NTP transferase domain-containing protein [Phycisphaerales bacterium]
MSTVLAVVIGRAGSKGLPGKNARVVAGRPMVCHSIEDALQAESVDRVVVSTDGDAIAAAARGMGVEVVRRPAELAHDTATVDSAVRHAVEALDDPAPLIVVLYANVPVRPPGLIDRAVRLLRDSGADSVQSYASVGKHHP